jgi:hypothetical protein
MGQAAGTGWNLIHLFALICAAACFIETGTLFIYRYIGMLEAGSAFRTTARSEVAQNAKARRHSATSPPPLPKGRSLKSACNHLRFTSPLYDCGDFTIRYLRECRVCGKVSRVDEVFPPKTPEIAAATEKARMNG